MKKKGLFAILAALAVFALVMTGCPTEDSGGGNKTKPVLATVPGTGGTVSGAGDYEVAQADVRLGVTVTNNQTIGAANLSFQWYVATSDLPEDSGYAGTTIGSLITGYTNGRNFYPPLIEAGSKWYWVVVTNTTTSESVTSTRAKVTAFVPTGDSDVERVISANSAVPLWEFKLPLDGDGAPTETWANYEEFSIQYYVSKFSNIALGDNVRSRLYGAYVKADFIDPDQGDAQGWGTNGGTQPGYTMINWNNSTFIVRDGVASINPNNDFILDNVRGSAKPWSELFQDESGGFGKWFTVKYTTKGNKWKGFAPPTETADTPNGFAKDFAKVPGVDPAVYDTIYVGAGLIQDGSHASTQYQFFVKNPTLLHKTDPTKNIRGNKVMTGKTTQLFAGNKNSNRAGTFREVITSYADNAGEVQVLFDRKGGISGYNTAIRIGLGGTLPGAFFDADGLGGIASAYRPTRPEYTFKGWYKGNVIEANKVTPSTTFDDTNTTLTAGWTMNFTKVDYVVDLTEQTTKNDTAWASDYSAGLVFSLDTTPSSFVAVRYDKVTIVAKYYDASNVEYKVDGEAAAPSNGNFQLKWYPPVSDPADAPANANSISPNAATETTYNFGVGGTAVTGGFSSKIDIPSNVMVAGLGYLAIQSSNGTKNAQYIEVVSITFGFND